MNEIHDFSFAKHAHGFDPHIRDSIWALADFWKYATAISPRFIAANTRVYDCGTSSGSFLKSVYDDFSERRPGVTFHGIDIEPAFAEQWQKLKAPSLTYTVGDIRQIEIERASLVISMFTVQFIPGPDKIPLLKRIHAGMIDGGCLLIAEKVLAETGRMQDALTFPYYDFKRANGFTAEEILNKERSLRGQMTLWTKSEAERTLRKSGFSDVQAIWAHFPFVCWLAFK